MPSPDMIAPNRLEELLGGAVPEGEHEARVQGLVRELRVGAAPAPASLRTRVAALGGEKPRRRALPLRRRAALALAFALVVATTAAVGAGLALRGSGAQDAAGPSAPAAAPEPVPAPFESEVQENDRGAGALSRSLGRTQAKDGVAFANTGSALVSGEGIDRKRATDVDLRVELRLRDADELADAAGAAMAITRDLNGWVAGSDVDTSGREGEAELHLRVPVGRVEDAVVRLSGLGTVTGQRMETVDLQTGIDRRNRRIEALDRAIRIGELRLASGTLGPEERLLVQLRLERQRAARTDLLRANTRDRRAAATAELTLLLHTREAPAAAERDEGEAAGAARDALRLLGAVGIVGLFLAIVLSPLALLAALLWLALRARLRRVETRLLDRPEPAGPPSPRG